MEQSRTPSELLEYLPISKAYYKMSIPLVMSLVVTIIYGLVDMYFVSATGETSLIAGVSLITPVYTMLMAFGDIFGYGGGALISQFLGKKDHLKTKQVSSFSFWSALSFGVAVSILLLLFRNPIISLLGADSDTFRHAESYYIWIALAAPAVLVYCTFLNIVRSYGKARDAMIAVIAGTVVNLVLDPILIFRFGMGAAGASLSTFIGMAVEAIGCVWIGIRKSEALTVSLKHVRLDGGSIRKMMSVGLSSSLTNAVQMVMLVITNLYLVRYSALAVSAMGIVQKVCLISYLLLLGFALGGQPLLGFAYGAGQKNRIREIFSFEMKVCITVAVALTVIIEIFAPRIMSLFVDNREIVFLGSQMLRTQYSAAVFQAFVLVVFSLGISFGDAQTPFVLSVSRQGIVFIAAVVVLARVFGYYGIISAQPAADLITAAIAFFLLKKRLRKNMD
ncbi:MAG: MATE family efflux transporter [Oscillospiraceae bacterium]|nr:MATE family efflux transporter [Oscillospiraceae bacterium]